MNRHSRSGRRILAMGIVVYVAGSCFSASANEASPSVAGLWNFDGDLSPTVGQSIETEGNPIFEFGRCSSWKLPRIDNSDDAVLRLGQPKEPSTRDYLKVFPGIPANGAGKRVNKYTLVMDVLFAAPYGQDGWTSILNLDGTNSEFLNFWYRGDTEREVQAEHLLHFGFKATRSQAVPSNTWLRVAFRVQARDARLHQDVFLNGKNIGVEAADFVPLDGRGSLPASTNRTPYLALWGNPYPDSNCQGTAYLSSLAIFLSVLSDEELAGLGGASAGGIPASWQVKAASLEDTKPAPTKIAAASHQEDEPKFTAPQSPVVVDVKAEDFTPMQIPDATGAPLYATHDFSEAIIPDGYNVYFAYFGKGSYVTGYNSENEKWSTPFLLGGVSDDQYAYPDMVMDHEGYIHAFYGSHGESKRGSDGLHYRRTVRPHDISEWEAVRYVGARCAFPRPYVLKDGRLVVLHRGSQFREAGHRDCGWGYIESADGGRTWSSFRRLVDEEYSLYGGGTILESEQGTPVIHWGWCWWDEPCCDLGMYYSPNFAVPCKYDHVLYAAFSLDNDMCWDGARNSHSLPLTKDSFKPLWNREYLSVADSTVNSSGQPVVLFSDLRDRTAPRMLIARYDHDDGWVIEEPLPGIPVAANNMRIRTAGPWTTIVAWEIGDAPGLFVAQRKDFRKPFRYRKLTRQRFPFQMHPSFKEDLSTGKLHVFWAEGDRVSPSRLFYGTVELDPTPDSE